ncbi:MAG: TonB-dependent receptor, partial [Prevotella sp.]|nr:TonB-dependent receptor [Prevotella sp.]
IYAQDDWNVNDKLKLTYGLRIDGLFFDNGDLMTNQAIYDLDYNGRHIDTGKWPSSRFTLSPRLGFTYDVFGDKTLKVRGGTGLFSGRLPLVFFTNMPTNSNMVQYKGAWNATGKNGGKKADMSQFAGNILTGNTLRDYVTTHDTNGNVVPATITDANGNIIRNPEALGPVTIRPEDGEAGSTINAVNPDFKMPQVWKSSIAIDYQLPVSFPLSVTAELIYNKTVNAVCISDWSVKNVGGYARFNGVDNRPIYQDYLLKYEKDGKIQSMPNAYVLDNTSKGYGWSFNFSVNAQPFEWMSLMAAYTHTASKELTGMPGSDASSAFTYIPSYEGPNSVMLHNSQYVTPDRIVASATIHDKADNHYSLIYETWRGGNNTTYLVQNDMNGDGFTYDVAYIPTDQEVANKEFRFVSDDDAQRFMDFVHNSDYLSDRQGKYAEAYSVYSPWVHRIDFSYKHDFKLNIGKTQHKLQVGFDMKNVLNFFNSSWGVQKIANLDYSSAPSNGVQYSRIIKYEGTDAQGYPVFSTPAAINGNTTKWKPYHSLGQCWYASIGVKYFFN